MWLMDDDGYPHEEALVTLEVAMKPEVACAFCRSFCAKTCRRISPLPFALLDRRGSQ